MAAPAPAKVAARTAAVTFFRAILIVVPFVVLNALQRRGTRDIGRSPLVPDVRPRVMVRTSHSKLPVCMDEGLAHI
ncbi:hypothetical protein GCM10027421_36400 [Microbacterium shaanxiense]